ncbi:hypothetical protein K493DRAFT_372866 [Basidiobolus meristosporus CBS 931.73]|uniref:FZ domain-containing protein n=1 Tax=Basidiobolus meristosporus CBS 931.73 TaxID=1314790 RepID=A0A1Y1YAH7_9FUNG|nr:hypothetical protein K493DRAFT_372866 [Basidiobolus meristosporus CBS 931.73]|eukprot:ORX95021.1 hypothetical protein K493DRAFT_372866 [Basidiobolus meristosporus CBS 931.73]
MPLLGESLTPKTSNLYLTLAICSSPENSKELDILDLFIFPDTASLDFGSKLNETLELKFRRETGPQVRRIIVQDISPLESFHVIIRAPSIQSTSEAIGVWEYELTLSTEGFTEVEAPTVLFHEADDSAAAFSIPLNSGRKGRLEVHVLPGGKHPTWMPSCMLAKKSLQSFYLNDDSTRDTIRFRVDNLKINSTYQVFYTEESPGRTNHRRVARGMLFGTTHIKSNCKTIQPATFCNMINYAVPSPSSITNLTALANMYDQLANDRYQQFEDALKRFDCTTIYSPVRTCDDCRKAYKNWICATSIPRCAVGALANVDNPGIKLRDSNPLDPVGPFTLHNTNAFSEYLPCLDLCWEVVRNCPIYFQFSCPDPGPSNVDYAAAPYCNNFTSLIPSQGVVPMLDPYRLSLLCLVYLVYHSWPY